MNDLTDRSLTFARKSAQAGLDATVTIAARTPGLMAAGFDLTGQGAREIRLMVDEKIAAAHEGAFAAQDGLGMVPHQCGLRRRVIAASSFARPGRRGGSRARTRAPPGARERATPYRIGADRLAGAGACLGPRGRTNPIPPNSCPSFADGAFCRLRRSAPLFRQRRLGHLWSLGLL
jgi:hypothetical protein